MARLLGLDFGERRLGFAVGDADCGIATPLDVVEVRGSGAMLDAVCRVAGETGAERIVVGLPVSLDGTMGPMAEKVREFCVALRRRIDVPVVTWDERFSTGIVERVLIEADMSRGKRKRVRDKLAAQVILQSYLDAQAPEDEGSG